MMLLFFAVFLVLILVSSVFLLQGNPPSKLLTNDNFEDNTTTEIEKIADEISKKENILHTRTTTSTLENVQLTSKPNFKVGEEYTYAVKYPNSDDVKEFYNRMPNTVLNDYMYFNMVFKVDKKERINKTDYYVISTEGPGELTAGFMKDEKGMMVPIKASIFSPDVVYINTETGEIIGNPKGVEQQQQRRFFYAPWILKLSNDLKWTEKTEEKSTGTVDCFNGKCEVNKENRESIKEESYEVKGIEKMNERNCFKIENILKSCVNGKCEIKNKKIFWVDVNKRITVKFQLWYQNLPVEEMDLIDYKK